MLVLMKLRVQQVLSLLDRSIKGQPGLVIAVRDTARRDPPMAYKPVTDSIDGYRRRLKSRNDFVGCPVFSIIG